LPEHRWFRFRRPDGHVVHTARNVEEFERIISQADINVVEHHLLHGDFSRWVLGTLQDRELAASVGAIERSAIAPRSAGLLSARKRIGHEVAKRYALSDYDADGERIDAEHEDSALSQRVRRASARSQELGAQTRALAAQYGQVQLRLASSRRRRHDTSATDLDDPEAPPPADLQRSSQAHEQHGDDSA